MYSTMHMQGTSEFYPQYYPTTFGQVSLDSYPSLLPNPPYMQETYKNYYEPPTPVTPSTQWFTSRSQDTSTTCESEVEHMDHKRKIRRRKQRKYCPQPSQLNDNRPFSPVQPTMPSTTQMPTFQYHQERPNNGTKTPQEKDEVRETNNGDSSNLGHISQILTTIHFLCCLCTMLLYFSMLPLYCATLRQ